MHSDATRAAFTLSLVHQRRDARRMTAVAVLQAGSRVFLGLDNGVLEEHRCVPASAAGSLPPAVAAAAGGMLVLRLLAEKKVFSKAAVAAICPVEAAARLVCMSDEGQVALVSLEEFAVAPLPAARGAVALAVQHSAGLPVLLAVAVRAGKGRSKVLLFNVLPGANLSSHQPAVLLAQVPVPEAVLGLAWAGSSLLLAVPGGYQALHPTSPHPPTQQQQQQQQQAVGYRLVVLADHLSSIQPLLGSIPEQGLGLLLWEESMVLVTDASGAAVREPLQLSMPPIALAAAGLFVVALCDDGVHVFDHTRGSREVQHIDFAHDDAYVRLSGRLPAAADASGRCICLATSSQVLRLEPVAIEQQVRELLKRKRFDQALELIRSTAAEAAAGGGSRPASPYQQQLSIGLPEPLHQESGGVTAAVARRPAWHQVALAQAALLLLLECEWAAGLALLEELDVATWQPCQLFGLFAAVTARWLPSMPARSYWGLHGQQLPELSQLVTDMLELRAATAPVRQQQQQQHEAHWMPSPRSAQQQQQHSPGSRSSSGRHPHPSSSGSSGSLSSGGYSSTVNPAKVQGLILAAKTAIAGYLSRARTRPGVVLLDGIDTLLLQLLCDVGDAAGVEMLLCGPHAAVAAAAAAALRAAGRWHGLALLQMNAGHPKEALQTWQALAAGQLTESSSSSSAVADADGDAAAVAVAAAAAAMAAGPEVVPLQLLLGEHSSSSSSSGDGFLRWLMVTDAAASLAVLEARSDLEPAAVLQLLEEVADIDLRWQYLYHQVHHNSSSEAHLHTQLATVLLAALAAHIAGSSSSSSSSSSAEGDAAPQGSSRVSREQLAQMVHQLPISFTPNADAAGAAAAAAAAGGGGGLAFTLSGAAHSSSLQQRQGSWHNQHQLPSLFSSISGTAQHSRSVSLIGGGIPSACFFAASVADIARRSSRELHPAAAAAAAAGSSSSAAAARQQQQQQPYRAFEHQQLRQRGNLGALAGVPVLPRTQTLARQGSAAVQGLRQALHSMPGFGTLAGGQQPGLQGPSKTFSNIAQMLQQHQMRMASSTGNAQQQQQQAALAHLQPQLSLGPMLSHEPPALRVLPGGLGPWPLETQLADKADAEEATGRGSSAAAEAGSSSSTDAAVVGRPAAAAAAAAAAAHDKVLLLRCLLVYHLQASLLYDAQAVLSAAQPLPLHPEQALLHSRLGDHPAALALLALAPPRLVEGAIAYCRALGSQEAWLALLELFLNPPRVPDGIGNGGGLGRGGSDEAAAVEPDYASACRVLNAEGASLNPLRLLAALPADMPLHLAGEPLGQVLSGLQHRRRHGQVVRSLYRCRRLAAHAELVQLQAQRVFHTEDTACNGCGRLIGSKVFYRYPSGVLVCGRCSGAVAAAGAGAAGTDAARAAEGEAAAAAAAGAVAGAGLGGVQAQPQLQGFFY
uniref:Uncharacterized protein n=1 Tax=Tetradesmus obliquus TaxID=3088 RepID=A0A383VGG5_TETOB|eukprot:jgi/Sobl393_1/15621/SZX64607.1